MAAPLVARFGTRQVVSVDGPDAKHYLQGQLSQDIEPLEIDQSTLSLVLSPQGKVDAWVRVTRVGDNTFWLDVDTGFAEQLESRLNRFLLRTEAKIAVTDLDTVSFRAVSDDEAALLPLDVNRLPDDEFRLVPALGWPQPGRDAIGEAVELRAFADRISEVDELDEAGWERIRIRAGVPAMGAELNDDTIPAAAGIVDESISFTKGCYTGQELVARIDSRGNRVPRFLCFGKAQGPVSTGSAIIAADGSTIGTVTSSAPDPDEMNVDQTVVLGYLSRGIELPLAATVTANGSQVDIALRAVGARS